MTKPVLGFFNRDNPTPEWNNPPQKEKEGMAITPEEIKTAMPAKLADNPTPQQIKTYYEGLESVGMKILKGFFAEEHHANLTARRPFGGLKTTAYYADAKKVKDVLFKDKDLKARSAEIGRAVALASQQMWLEKSSIPNIEKMTLEEKVDAIRIKNDDVKKDLLTEWFTLPDDKRVMKTFKGRVTKAKKAKPAKAAPSKGKPAKAKPQPAVVKTKPVIGKKEIDALIKQAETAEKELTKAKSDFDKAMDKVWKAHAKIKEELLVNKRLLDREG